MVFAFGIDIINGKYLPRCKMSANLLLKMMKKRDKLHNFCMCR